MRTLQVAVIGLGVGEQHAIGYARNPNCELAAVCDLSDDKLSAVSVGGDNVRKTRSADEVLSDPSIDVVSIASFDGDHFGQVVGALEAGKHVFVEKPMCLTHDELRQIKAAWSRHEGRLKLQSNLVLRAAPVYRWLREQISTNALGDVYAFDGDYLYGRLSKITSGWRSETDGYSVMSGGGVHLLDLMLWTTQQRPETIHTIGNRICTGGTSFRYDDFAAATLTFSSGMIGRVTANFGCVHGHQHVVRAFGTKGTFLYDDQGPRYQQQRDPAPPAEPLDLSALPESKYVLLNNFVDAILQDRNMSTETQIDFDVMSVCMASDASLRTGGRVEIEYV